jgi:two-component system, NarL family, nitrate/nitrite response regulator NarL
MSDKETVAPLESTSFPSGERQLVRMVLEPPRKIIRVMIMSNHAITRDGLHLIIEQQPGFRIVSETIIRADDLAAAGEQPDVILIDFDSFNSSDFLTKLREAMDGPPVLILMSTRGSEADYFVLRLGAMGVVFKDEPAEVVVKAIEKVHAGEIWLERSKLTRALREISWAKRPKSWDAEAAKIDTLTKREREVVALIGEGLSSDKVAKRLFISETTVRHHLTSIFDKLGVCSSFELVFYGYSHGLATPPVLTPLSPRKEVIQWQKDLVDTRSSVDRVRKELRPQP